MNHQALDTYIKTKKEWDEASSVRTSEETYELKLDKIDKEGDSIWNFSTHCPILNHNEFKSLTNDQKKYVMGLQLLEFVLKTTKFEIDYVNKVANNLALEKYNFKIPNILKIDALKIYTDEGYHAYFSQKIADQIMDYFNIKDDLSPYIKKFFDKIDKIGSQNEKKYEFLSNLSNVIVSESMICQDISKEMKGIVYEPIRIMFKDHMHDEYFHANFFGTLFKILWPQLSDKEKEILGLNLYDSINAFAEPRTDIYFYSLSKLGFTNEFISKCINKTYDNDEWKIVNAKKKMSHPLKLLDSCGIFEIPSVSKKFKTRGFI